MEISTKNFNPKVDKKLLCTCGNSGCDKRSVKQSVLDKLQLVRDDLGRGLIVNSGGRCPLHESEIHREKPADHQKCQAVDVAISGGLQRGEIVELGIKHGFNAIGVAKTFIHLGVRDELANGELMMWTY